MTRPTSDILRAIARHGYEPDADTTGETRDVLLALAKRLEQPVTITHPLLEWDFLRRRT